MGTVHCLRRQQRDIDGLGETTVGTDVKLPHWFLIPEETHLVQSAAHIDRVEQVESSRTVVHQFNVRSDMIAKVLTELGVPLRIAPSVQLYGFEAIVEALVGDIEELGRILERHRAGISGNTVTGATDHLVERETCDLGGQIPECSICDAECINRKLLDTVDFPNFSPEM